MPQSTTALPTRTDQPKPDQPRVEIPTAAAPDATRPARRARATPDDARDEGEYVDVLDDDRIPRMEPWLRVLLASLGTAALALFVPQAARPPLFAVTGVLLLAGFAMLIVQERRRGR